MLRSTARHFGELRADCAFAVLEAGENVDLCFRASATIADQLTTLKAAVQAGQLAIANWASLSPMTSTGLESARGAGHRVVVEIAIHKAVNKHVAPAIVQFAIELLPTPRGSEENPVQPQG